jgi:predicted transcriptional regulator
MSSDAVLFSIRPKYAEKIFNGTKTIELRKVKPKRLTQGGLIFVYVSSPVKSLVGAFKVKKIEEYSPSEMWEKVREYAGISKSEFDEYYQNSTSGVAIYIDNVWKLPKPIELSTLRKSTEGFYPPQSFRYTSLKYLGEKILL